MLEDLPSKTMGFKTLFLTWSVIILAGKMPLSSWGLSIGSYSSLLLELWTLAVAEQCCTFKISGSSPEQKSVVRKKG